MKEELEYMKINEVWDLVNLSIRCRAIGKKCILKVKCKLNGSRERHKSRYVAKSFTQEDGID